MNYDKGGCKLEDGGAEETTTRSPVTTAYPMPECEDDYDTRRCEKMAENGDCQSNTSWMRKNCAKTCNLCEKPACKDKQTTSRCKELSSKGGCEAETEWMRINCAKTCSMCDEEECVDKKGEDRCKELATKG